MNKTARESFWILCIGVLFIIVATLFVFTLYYRQTAEHGLSERGLQHELIRAVYLATAIAPEKLVKHLRMLPARGMRMQLSDAPDLKAQQQFDTFDSKRLQEIVQKYKRNFHISLLLKNGQWLNIQSRGRANHHPWLLLGFLASAFLLLAAMILLCGWVVNRLSLPLAEFAKATHRFGMDVQAPPMAVTGPPEMQDAIKAFNDMQSRVRRLLNDRTQMLAAISHDLRAPITRLQLRAEYLQGTSQYEKAIADLKEMEQMIASILAFARDYVSTEAMERFDINALLESLCDDLQDSGLQVEYTGTLQRTAYEGRVSALKRAFTNLIENAVKYGKIARVTLTADHQALHIKICDEGPGIPPSQMEKVFDPFYRIDPARSPQTSGTGLGLSVARDVIQAHGGSIELFNRDPRGLTAIISLPLR